MITRYRIDFEQTTTLRLYPLICFMHWPIALTGRVIGSNSTHSIRSVFHNIYTVLLSTQLVTMDNSRTNDCETGC